MKSRILYEDEDMIVCHKPAGIATQTARVGQRDMVSEITADSFAISPINSASYCFSVWKHISKC